jgi:hypothetical protein
MDQWEEKFVRLPSTCSTPRLLTWIAFHPAMKRKTEGHRVVLSMEDIEGAPSRGAVTQLQSFVNRPKEFYDRILSGR